MSRYLLVELGDNLGPELLKPVGPNGRQLVERHARSLVGRRAITVCGRLVLAVVRLGGNPVFGQFDRQRVVEALLDRRQHGWPLGMERNHRVEVDAERRLGELPVRVIRRVQLGEQGLALVGAIGGLIAAGFGEALAAGERQRRREPLVGPDEFVVEVRGVEFVDGVVGEQERQPRPFDERPVCTPIVVARTRLDLSVEPLVAPTRLGVEEELELLVGGEVAGGTLPDAGRGRERATPPPGRRHGAACRTHRSRCRAGARQPGLRAAP